MAAAALAGCAPILRDADLVPVRAARSADTGVTRTDGAYANAIAAIDRRDYARALELLQMARQQNAGDVRVLNAMGVVYDKLGRFDLSRRYYAEAAKADPNSPIVQANMAYSQRLQDGPSEAQFAEAPVGPLQQLQAETPVQPTAPPQQVEMAAPLKVRTVVAERPPLRIVNATGRLHRAEPIRASLAALGWSAPRWAMAEARPQARTVIVYPPSRVAVAKALARTLPGSARLAACTNGCAGLRLVLGADAQSWKPMPRPVTRTRSRIA
jgi:tetratricopeptide (TPR) repeat protein